MKVFKRISVLLALAVVFTVPSFAVHKQTAEAASAKDITTTATGYTTASDVQYKYVTDSTDHNKYRVNWGARGEDSTFLSKYAVEFYGEDYTLSTKTGNVNKGQVPSSALYKELQSLMKSKHGKETGYQSTRYMYRYTDCVSNEFSHISSFYSGKKLDGTWDSGKTYNREHTWPNSKGLDGNDENDIIMLRPTWTTENSDRGDLAYGESIGYYDPNGDDDDMRGVRGDCARIWLYVYVRWGNTQYAWGTSGVMESVDILLKWMEEDPVDTWEMGRNDATQYITGTRNVFVDYPEYAWLLFGEDIPDNMSTPSGMAKNGTGGGNVSGGGSSENGGNTGGGSTEDTCEHVYGEWITLKKPTQDTEGVRAKVCSECGDTIREAIPKLCEHAYGDWIILKQPTAETEGKRAKVCNLCGDTVRETIPKLGDESSCKSSISGAAVLITALGACVIVLKKREN